MRIGPLGIWELLIILVVVLLIFGPRRLPEMAKGLGQSVREFRKGIRDIKGDFEEGQNEPANAPAQQARTTDTPATAPKASSEAQAGEPQEETPDNANHKSG